MIQSLARLELRVTISIVCFVGDSDNNYASTSVKTWLFTPRQRAAHHWNINLTICY